MHSRRHRKKVRRMYAALLAVTMVFAGVTGWRKYEDHRREMRLEPLRNWTKTFVSTLPSDASSDFRKLELTREGRTLILSVNGREVLKGDGFQPEGELPIPGEDLRAGQVLLKEVVYLQAVNSESPFRQGTATIQLETTVAVPFDPAFQGYRLSPDNSQFLLSGEWRHRDRADEVFRVRATGPMAKYVPPDQIRKAVDNGGRISRAPAGGKGLDIQGGLEDKLHRLRSF